MTTRPERRPVHAYVPVESHTALHDFAMTSGASLSAVLDALGRRLAGGQRTLNMIEVAKQAAQIDAKDWRRLR